MQRGKGDPPHVGRVPGDEVDWQGRGPGPRKGQDVPGDRLTVSTPPANISVILALTSSKSSLLFFRRRWRMPG